MEAKQIENIFDIRGFCTAFPFAWNAQFVFTGECHEMWEVIFLTSGRVEVTEDEKIYTLSEGDMIFHAPMEFHRIRSAGGTSPTGYILSFLASGKLPQELKNGLFKLSAKEMTEYEDICRKVVSFVEGESENDPYAGQEATARLTSFFIRLQYERSAESNLVTGPSATAYRRLVSAMTEALEENLPLPDIAASCYVSVSYLKALFRKYAGISPKAYYTNLRLQHATALLRQGLTAADVAARMNFSSPNYFSSFFKKHTGKSPSAYRKT